LLGIQIDENFNWGVLRC